MERKFNFKNEKKSMIFELIKYGLDENQAEIIADCFATADLYGVTSHGCITMQSHIQKIKFGNYNLKPNFRILKETSAFAVIDGDNAFGPVSAKFCLDFAIKKCREVGVYSIFSRNNNTFGPAFYYSLKAAELGCIAFICSNSPAQMAPIGGKEKMLGTNPFAIVIPVPQEEPIIIDMATSIVAKSKFKQYKEIGQELPDGWALDKDGNPTNDPDEGIQGMVLPMAGFKGYAISMLIDIMSGVLSGAAYLDKVGKFYSNNKDGMNVGFYMTAIDPQIVVGNEYQNIIHDFVSRLRNSKTILGEKIVLPGDDRISCMHEKGQ
ncbi:Ldh family oxidoreductase [uncultured Thomasclavelia sp.]|uniref:Ldh family oxidoreductase n=1 Tax=uncultured Thomasclavelia sp. TaxID=3025759 RepID=UPI0026351D6F|nr:Ldh family oxidoreductase [uncultured Thomasclavelia sp.]